VSPVKYELSFYIPEDGSVHSHRREVLKSYMIQTNNFIICDFWIKVKDQYLLPYNPKTVTLCCLNSHDFPVLISQLQNKEAGHADIIDL
jgi:hypothetical protein